MKLFFCPNVYTEFQKEQARSACSLFQDSEDICSFSKEDSMALYQDTSHAILPPEECDLIVSLGGDGAVLRAASVALSSGKPLLGINSGRLGYLCAMSYEDLPFFHSMLKRCLPLKRALLEYQGPERIRYALNDITIGKQNFGETLALSVTVDGNPLGEIRGDGMIIATPTGSTAYNLSAGGSAVDPTASVLTLTPICSHSSFSAPVIINDTREVTLFPSSRNADLFIDGAKEGTLTAPVTIRKSDRTVTLMTPKESVLQFGRRSQFEK